MFVLYCILLCCIICGLGSIFMLLLWMGFTTVVVVGNSMAPALLRGEKVLICRWWPSRFLWKGLIVLLDPLYQTNTIKRKEKTSFYLKRIVGIGEEIITIKTHNHESLPVAGKHALDYRQEQQSWYIPRKHIFVCGDNSVYSIDSRGWGPVPTSTVFGVMLMRLSCRHRIISSGKA